MGKIYSLIYKYHKALSDMHFHTGDVPYGRHNGEISALEEEIITKEDLEETIKEIKLPEEKLTELKEKGATDYGYQLEDLTSLRLNFYYQRNTLSLACRILKGVIPEFEELNLPSQMKNILSTKSGLVLVTGLTGNGKSTTIASLINLINKNEKKHIITIEDPIEYRYPKAKSFVTQREVYTDCDSFEEGLRSALRQDPDIIVIGEIRDKETINVTLEAAESGHLVFSTLHTSSAATSIDRIISYFSDEEQNTVRAKLANVLTGVFTQKLIKSIDGSCMYPAVEVMLPTISIKSLIREGKIFQISNYIKMNKQFDMVDMDERLAEMVNNGLISKEDALLNANDIQHFTNSLQEQEPIIEKKKGIFNKQ